MRACLLAAVLALCVCALAQDATPASNKVLVVLPQLGFKDDFTIFFKYLSDRGYELSFFAAAEAPALTNYDHMILFAPEYDFTGELKPEAIIKFIDSGHNAIIASHLQFSDSLAEIFEACGFELQTSADERSAIALVDHVHAIEEEGHPHHVLVALPGPDAEIAASPILGGAAIGPVVYKGACARIVDTKSPLHTALLHGQPSSYCADPRRPLPATAKPLVGSSAVLVAALQSRNNARVIVSGSLEIFTDKFFETTVADKPAGNRALCEQSAAWAFQERGRLRIREAPKFVKTAGLPNSEENVFTVKDTMKYTVAIEEWDQKEQKWAPFTKDDVQLEVVMLDPYIRTYLKPVAGTYTAEFTLPDVYGVYTLRLAYRRLGYSWVIAEDRVPIRPLRHNQFERFIPSAFPYYTAALSMIVGTVLFAFVFLFHKERKPVAQNS
eukprot:TRINITY_DN18786_c0_g1_i1.p1 TRINITY_DN18786_c0_g1~~TRINITY_DN18786_c0_g1_i1.p1  ORF type:complete len:461 (-),score=127.96 TRINITY_DN18786_c0_g1_i1:69-1388(-)